MNKDIKYLIENIVNFNPVDYEDDESDLIILDDMNKLLITPETKEELVSLIKERVRENPLKPYLLDICTSLITDMSKLFYSYENIKVLDLRTWDTSNVTDMSNMFAFCKSVKKIRFIKFGCF